MCGRSLNVKGVCYEQDEAKYIALFAKPNFPRLGKRLGKKMRAFKAKIEALDASSIEAFQRHGTIELDGEVFTADDINIFREARAGTNAVSNSYVSIDLDCTLDEDLLREGWAREVVHHVQRARKATGLAVSDRIRVAYQGEEELQRAIALHRDYIAGETLAREFERSSAVDEAEGTAYDALIDGKSLTFAIRLAA